MFSVWIVNRWNRVDLMRCRCAMVYLAPILLVLGDTSRLRGAALGRRFVWRTAGEVPCMAGSLKSGCWCFALAAIAWVWAPEVSSAAAERLAVTSLPEGMTAYVRHDGLRGCHADIHLRIQLDPESTISAGQVHRLVPRIGMAAAEQCPVAVAARLEVVRGDQPNTVINTVTALKVKDWLAEPSWGESPVLQLHPARVDWDTKCANRTSLLDRARQEPSTAPGWLRGAWDQAGDWVASSLQWVGVTAAGLSSGQWPGEFRARVADFEAAGASLCVLAQQELDHTGAALGSGRLDAAARYITNAKDLLTQVEAADQTANAYYVGAVDRAETHWEIVFNTSKTAFSVTLAVGTAGGSVAPSAAGYYALKYGLFNALEFAVDSTEMSLTDAAARSAQRLAVELLVDGLIGQLLPNDFSYERLVAQGELAKADAFLANASADLVQQLSAGLRPELLRQVAEEALAQATDAAVRAAIEQEILKHGAYFLASALEDGNETIRGLASNFGAEYLAKRGTPSSGNCLGKAFVVVRGQETCDFFLDEDGAIHHRGQKISEPILVTGSSSGDQIFAQSLFVHPPSPSGIYYFIQACEGVSSSPGLCWSQWSFDADNRALNRTFAGKYGPHPFISWGPDDQLAGLFYSDEGFSQIYIVNAQTGGSWAFPDWGSAAADASSLIVENESLVWVDPTKFYVDARFCTALKPSERCYDLERLSVMPVERVLFHVRADGVNPVVTEAISLETYDQAVAGLTAPPDSWRGQPSVEQALEDVVTAYAPRAFDGCTRAHGPIAPEFRRRLLAKTVLTIVDGQGRRAQRPITNQLLDNDRFCLSHNIGECVGYNYQLYYCASAETPFINVASSTVRYRVTNVEPMQKSPWVTGRIDSRVFGTDTHRPVEGQNCHISNGWSDVTGVRWSGACENGRVTGRGILEWLKGPEIIWRTRVGPEWGMTLTEGTLRFALDLDTFDFTLDSCNQYNRLGSTGRRTAVVAAPAGKPAEYFENTWIVEQLLSRAAYFAHAECPLLPKEGFSHIKVSIRHADGKEIVSGSNANADSLDWSQVSNSAVTAMKRELTQAQRNRDAVERQRAAQVRAQALASEFEARRNVIEERARSFIASGQGKIEDLAAALEIDQLGTLGRLEKGVTLWLEPADGVDTVNHEGTRHYRVSYTGTPPLAQLEQEFRSKQDFSWENWMTMIQAANPFRRTQLSCLFENVARIPSEARNVSGSLLSFSGSSDSLAISLLCD